jgi:hypothetical protein
MITNPVPDENGKNQKRVVAANYIGGFDGGPWRFMNLL